MPRNNLGIFNNNWKGGSHWDEPEGEPLPARRVLEIRIETLQQILKSLTGNIGGPDFRNELQGKIQKAQEELAELDNVDRQVMQQVTAELVTQELAHSHKTLNAMPDPRIARRDSILAAFEDEPLNKAEATALIAELAEIDQALQFNPADALQLAPAEEMIF